MAAALMLVDSSTLPVHKTPTKTCQLHVARETFVVRATAIMNYSTQHHI